MAIIRPIVIAELGTDDPVKEVCEVISALMPYHPSRETVILHALQDRIARRIKQLEGGAHHGEPVREPERPKQDQ